MTPETTIHCAGCQGTDYIGRQCRGRAALTPPAPTLDVERLYDALTVVTRPLLFPGDRGAHAWRQRTAEAIAREYDRLAAESDTPRVMPHQELIEWQRKADRHDSSDPPVSG